MILWVVLLIVGAYILYLTIMWYKVAKWLDEDNKHFIKLTKKDDEG